MSFFDIDLFDPAGTHEKRSKSAMQRIIDCRMKGLEGQRKRDRWTAEEREAEEQALRDQVAQFIAAGRITICPPAASPGSA